jgi:membrane protein required for beta-lactamase induction
MFGILFIVTHFLNTLATRAVYRSNPYNQNLQNINHNSYYMNLPLIIIAIGVILTYTIFVPGIYYACLISIILWILIGRLLRRDNDGN